MAIGLKQHQSDIFTGLGTWTYTIPAGSLGVAPGPGLWSIDAVSTIYQPPTSLSIVINKNGSPIATSSTPTSTEQVVFAKVNRMSFAAADVITIVLTSSAALDAVPNAIKTLITLTQVG